MQVEVDDIVVIDRGIEGGILNAEAGCRCSSFSMNVLPQFSSLETKTNASQVEAANEGA